MKLQNQPYRPLLSILWLIIPLLAGCSLLRTSPNWTPENSLLESPPPVIDDESDEGSLIHALSESVRYYYSLPPDTKFRYGERLVPVQATIASSLELRDLVIGHGLSRDTFKTIEREFCFFRSAGYPVMVTGYYEAELNGSRTPTSRYKYPVYRKPQDEDSHYTREEIDFDGALEGKGLEIAWVDDPVALFFLHIQGSGVISFEDGTKTEISFDAKNGQPYRAIGRVLKEKGLLGEDTSMQAIRNLLAKRPERAREIFSSNPSYIYFKEVSEGPLGNIQVPLTGGRSIATDASIFPKGAPGFLVSEKPKLNSQLAVSGWEPFTRMIFNQDTGGAIKGAAHIDLFFGKGPEAEAGAGHMKQNGDLYFVLLKSAIDGAGLKCTELSKQLALNTF